MKHIIFLIFIIAFFTTNAQNIKLNGYVLDAASGEQLPFAHILTKRNGAVVCNQYGYYVAHCQKDSVNIEVSYVGYLTLDTIISTKVDSHINFHLKTNNTLEEVIVKDRKIFQKGSIIPGSSFLSHHDLELSPALFGEKDVLKTIQLLPGIKTTRDGTSGYSVRGGTSGQNLVLLDNVPVYNTKHLFGIFSVFNPNSIKNTAVYKGAFPARYGGRISSVADITMREGNLYKMKTDATIGTISSKIIFETPLRVGKSSFFISARRTYADLFLKPFLSLSNQEDTKETFGYHFYDINSKLHFNFREEGYLTFSFYTGTDKFSYLYEIDDLDKKIIGTDGYTKNRKSSTSNIIKWGNITSSARLHCPIARSLFMDMTLYFTQYQYRIKNTDIEERYYSDTLKSNSKVIHQSDIQDVGFNLNLSYSHSSFLNFKTGAKIIHHQFLPCKMQMNYSNNNNVSINLDNNIRKTSSNEINAYFESEISIASLKIVPGFHWSNYLSTQNIYSQLQPRLYSTFNIGRTTFKGSIGKMIQPVHNVINNASFLPIDIWLPSEAHVKPSESMNSDLGLEYSFPKDYSFNAEIYYRKMKNIISYKQGETFFYSSGKWFDKIYVGEGQSFGMELLVKKSKGKTTGWLGYTLSKSMQQFDMLNNGNQYRFPFDHRHYITAVFNHQLNNNINFSASWVYGSGQPVTLSSTSYKGIVDYSPEEKSSMGFALFDTEISGSDQAVYYSAINNQNYPSYHHLDINIDFLKSKKQGQRTWSLSVYNIYAHNNPFVIYPDYNKQGDWVLKNITLFNFLPSITYRYVFK